MAGEAAPVPAPRTAPKVERPAFKLKHNPERLSNNADRRNEQIGMIATRPTDKQEKQVAQRFQEEDPGMSPAEAQDLARGRLTNFAELRAERAAVARAEREARSAALERGISKDEFRARVRALRDVREWRKMIDEDLKEAGEKFRDIDLQVEPEQQAEGIRDKIGDLFHLLGWQMAAGGAKVGRGAEAGRAAVGAAAGELRDRAGAAAGAVRGGAEATWGVATGVPGRVAEAGRNVAGAVGGYAERVGGAAAAGIDNALAGAGRVGERVAQRGREVFAAGRDGIFGLLRGAGVRIRGVAEAGRERFSQLTAAVGAQAENVRAAAGGVLEAARQAGAGVAERVGGAIGPRLEVATAFVNRMREGITTRAGELSKGANELLQNARAGAAARIEGFVNACQTAGTEAGTGIGETGRAIQAFAREQATNLDNLQRQIRQRVQDEVQVARARIAIRLEPFWDRVNQEREGMRDQRAMMGERLGILVEWASDLASPVIDRIVDGGRDARDAALGLTRSQVEAMRVFGRGVGTWARERTDPVWQSLVERWESMRLRANDARERLNGFLGAALGPVGARFRQLQEGAAGRAARTGELLREAQVVGGRVLQRGREVPGDVAEWFAARGATARELLGRNLERAGQGLELLQRYWRVYALDRLRELGADATTTRRFDILSRGVGGASLGRLREGLGRAGTAVGEAAFTAAARGTALTMEVLSDPKARVALPAIALLLWLAVNQEARDNLMTALGNLGQGAAAGLGPDAGIAAPQAPTGLEGIQGPDASNVAPLGSGLGSEAAPNLGAGIGSPPVTGGEMDGTATIVPGGVEIGGAAGSAASGTSLGSETATNGVGTITAVGTGGETGGTAVASGGVTGVESAAPAGGTDGLAAITAPGPEATNGAGFVAHVPEGSNVWTEAEKLAGGDPAMFQDILEQTFVQNADKFEQFARDAQDPQQLAAIDELRQILAERTIDASRQRPDLDALMTAMRGVGPF